MKDFLLNLVKQYAADRGVWVAVSAFLSHVVCKWLKMENETTTVTDGLVAFFVWAVTHFLHVKVVDNKLQQAVVINPLNPEPNPIEKDINIKG